MRFTFRFRGAPIEVVPAELVARSSRLARLRQHLVEVAGGREALADRALAGFVARCIGHYGEAYLTRIEGALERIYKAREELAEQVDRVTRGEAPDAQRAKQQLTDIEAAFDLITNPDAPPPALPVEIMQLGGIAAPRIASLGDFLGRVGKAAERLSAKERELLTRADEADSQGLRALLAAEDAGTLRPGREPATSKRAYDRLVRTLQERGMSSRDVQTLLGAVERLNTAFRQGDTFTSPGYQLHLDAAINALAEYGLRDVGQLQSAIRGNPTLQSLLMSHPARLRELWQGYKDKFRPYTFARYTLFNMYHARGAFGEWAAAFELGATGTFIFLKAPKAEVTTGGTDLVAVDINSGEVLVIDNKATGIRGRIIDKVSALLRNFPKNLRDDVISFKQAVGENPPPAIAAVLRRLELAEARIQRIVDLLPADPAQRKAALDRNALVTLPSGERVPVQQAISDVLQVHGIQRVVTDAGSPGFVQRLSTALDDAGLVLEQIADDLPE